MAQLRYRVALAVVFFSAIAALVVGRPLFDGSRVAFAVDGATTQLPWSRAIEGGPGEARDPGLSDLAVAFYPAYRHVAQRLAAGELPLWNPNVQAGVPCLANPQWGVLDPGVGCLALAERIGGKELFDRALAWLAALRILGAAFGAWLLATALGLRGPGAVLAGVGYALSGSVLGWLHFSVGHVTPWLPWVLLGVEGCAGSRPRRSAACAALALTFAVLGGHPETAFFIGLAAAARAVTLAGGASGSPGARGAARHALLALLAGGLLAGAGLVPFLEYLAHSGALVAHGMREAGTGSFDFAALGALALLGGVTLHARSALAGHRTHAALNIAAASGLVAATWILRARGLDERAGVTIFFDLFRSPLDAGGYRGRGAYIEAASTWIAMPVLVLALASVLAGGRERMRGASFYTVLAALAGAVALALPGVIDIWRSLPVVGDAAPARAGSVAALALCLLAGDALERVGSPARLAAALVCATAGLFVLRAPAPPHALPELRAADADDQLYGLDAPLPETVGSGPVPIAGWLHGGLPAQFATLSLEAIDAAGRPLPGAGLEVPVRLGPAAAGTAEQGGLIPRRFHASGLRAEYLHEGLWQVRLNFQKGAPGALEPLGSGRRLGVLRVARPREPSPLSLGIVALSLLAVCAITLARPAPMRWILVALTAVQGLAFARSTNPDVARAEVFPETRTTELLRDLQGDGRVLGGPGVLVYNTGLAHGLRGLDGYDALDVASFDGYRAYAMHPGTNPLLDWNARGVNLDSPAFRLFGVRALAMADELEHPAWELVARPPDAETWVYRAAEPMPRAFCVARIVTREDVLADPMSFDPRTTAFLEDDQGWAPAAPFTTQAVGDLHLDSEEVSLSVDLDGDGLLVLTEQSFPGWTVTVDGVPDKILRVDSIFRGVVLAAGEHEVVFAYRPRSFVLGTLVSLLGVLVLVLVVRLPK